MNRTEKKYLSGKDINEDIIDRAENDRLKRAEEEYLIQIGKAINNKEFDNIHYKNEQLKQKYPQLFINGFIENRDISNISVNISGLLSFNVYYNPKYKKVVYILGEQHNFNNICDDPSNILPADEFFMLLLNSDPNVKKDVFLESIYDPLIPSTENRFFSPFRVENSGYMLKVIQKLQMEGCLSSRVKDSCTYYRNHTRFHSTDIRIPKIDIIQYLRLIRQLKDYSNMEPNFMNIITTEIKKFTRYENYDTFIEEMVQSLKDLKVFDQIENINPEYPEIKTLLFNTLKDIITDQFNIFNYTKLSVLIDEYHNFINNGYPVSLSDFSQRHELLRVNLVLDTIIMDMYTVARMFRKFTRKETTNSSKNELKMVDSGDFPEEPKNIMIYVGELHAKFYDFFLKALKFTKLYSASPDNPKNSACLTIKNLDLKWVCLSERESCIKPITKSLENWSSDDVMNWFNSIKYSISPETSTIENIQLILKSNKIDGEKLLQISDVKELRELGVIFGPSVKLFDKIKILKNQYK